MTSPDPKSPRYWIIVANESKAIVYTQERKRSPLQKLGELNNDDSRKKVGDLLSDRRGRAFDSHGQGRHAMERTDPKRQAAIAFAKTIAERTSKALHNGRCRGFGLIAAPRFLGILRDALAVAGHADAFVEIDKDVVAKEPAFIAKLLEEH